MTAHNADGVRLPAWDCRSCGTTNAGGRYCSQCRLDRDGPHNADDIAAGVAALPADWLVREKYVRDILDAVSDRIAARAYDEGRTAGIMTFQDDRYEQGQIDALTDAADVWDSLDGQPILTAPFQIAEWLRARAADLGDDPCGGTGTVECWSPGGPCPEGQAVCESCGPCRWEGHGAGLGETPPGYINEDGELHYRAVDLGERLDSTPTGDNPGTVDP